MYAPGKLTVLLGEVEPALETFNCAQPLCLHQL